MSDEGAARDLLSARSVAPDRTFQLTRYFLVTGVITALVVAAALSALSAREIGEDLKDKSQDYAVFIARNLNLQIRNRFVNTFVARDGFVDLDRPDHLAALDAIVRETIAEFQVRDVYVFDLRGLIVYSTRPEHRSGIVRDNPNYAHACEGHVSTVLVSRGSPLDVSGLPGSVPLLETYVPVEEVGGGRTGVIEIYQDATELVSETRRATRRVALISTVGIVSLMLGLWVLVRKADRTIIERSRALVEANERLAALSADLERQVADRTERLVRAETLARLGTVAAGVAHEVNNPMAAIASSAEGLLRRCRAETLKADPAFSDFPEYLEIIRDEAFRVKEITRNLLDLSRSGEARPTATVDLVALVQATARLLHHRVEREGKRLLVDVPAPGPIEVQGDGAELRQLVLNVTVNAIDATELGGTIRWEVRGTDAGAELVCQDDGRGLAPEDIAHACEPFFTRKPVGEGTGLGLSIAFAIARRHGGALELSSDGPGRGARVRVRLAKAAAGAADDAKRAEAHHA